MLTGESLVMQAVVSQTVDVGIKSVSRKQLKQTRSHATRESSSAVELVREITPTPFADLQLVADALTEITPRERSEAVGRAVNVVVAAVALLILLPIIALIALAIKLTSRGPVLYSQTRVGLDRRY